MGCFTHDCFDESSIAEVANVLDEEQETRIDLVILK
jgi:hypothetical protein